MADSTENVAEEVQQEGVIPPPMENTSPALPTQETSENLEENSKEYNFKKLRETNRQLEERVRKSEETLNSIAASNQQSTSSIEENEIGEEDLVEGKHLKKAITKIEEMIVQKEMEAIPDKLRGRFSDFDEVVTQENLNKLKDTEPEMYRTIRTGTDLFAKGIAAYKTLKSLGIVQEDKNYMKHKEQVQSNHKKPLSAQSINGAGALHEANIFANGLTPELQKQLRKEMAEAVKAR